ncbi:hypothetical protein PSEUBRA_005490 [Kalmanozyma brasiliensis GHG001]|uniref:Uncharacterized protein n=1 Tax=Kalmanozyma brasiliensis (strain GHG001) TaxID=1365824 RepID=V5ETA5_KALBG|nr:uncharacterized protein PSEUBRA_005490 [Kalmanozyma brasiliensis GHG001]EST05224.1 hypothetical protein PSEUBRA_005490 [Kalmanozyma brasiliensis GHG001]
MNDQSSSSGQGANRPGSGGAGTTALPGLAGTQSEKQLTQRELAALRTIKRNVDTTKYGGWLLGAAGTWVLLARRKPQPRLISKLGWCVVGGLGGSFLTMPVGILMSRNVLKDVEDPQHLRAVLTGAMEERRQGKRPQVGVAPPKGLNGETEFDQQPQQPQQQQEWGGERDASSYGAGFDNGASTADAFNAYSAAQGSSSPRGNGGRTAASEPSSGSPPDGTGAGTRWAQLRGERGVEPSKWDKIRQDNARTAYGNRTASSQSGQNNSQDPSTFSTAANPAARPQSSGAPSSPRAPPRNRDEPVMTLSGAEDDPRWSSPATFSPQSSGWGNNEFLDDPAAKSARNAKRGYGVFSVLEPPPSSTYQLESDAPIQVVKGSLLTALAGGVGGSIYGVLRGRQGAGTVLGTRMAFSSFAFAFPFFAVREYVMSPVLNRTSSGPDLKERTMRLRTVATNRHSDKVLASSLAGAVVGAGAAVLTRGVGAVHKGVVTFGVACAGLQFLGNEARIVRDTMIRPAPRQVAVPNGSDAAVAASQAVAPIAEVKKDEGKTGWMGKVKNAMPIRSVSDEEYESKLKERLSGVNQRMADVEMEIREIEGLIQQQEAKQPE